MSLDINTKKLKKNAFRVTKRRGYTASRIRVPGGHLDAKLLLNIQEIADTYGDGTVHITTRQGFEIPGIDMKDIPEVNKKLQPIIEALEINQENPGDGYNAAGTRNVSACIGNNVCPFANYNTTNFAKKIEKAIFPNDLHFKIALTGCPNDCIKARMHDFGIIGMTEPQYERNRCVSCGACVRACKKKATGALSFENFKVVRDGSKCIGCGECVMNCPTNAWTRSKEKYYRLAIMGRTGKKNPRLAEDFILWVDEDSIIKIILNTYKYVTEYIDKNAPGGKEHIGYIIDRTGFMEFKKWALEGVTLSEKVLMKNNVYWSGIHYTNGF
ncbi:sulfite reductase subunit C [Clostridium perfringens]|nr:sulfite reductase subunit C [Clostridium perfringens]